MLATEDNGQLELPILKCISTDFPTYKTFIMKRGEK
jgi:hypothetical protein